MRDLALEAYFGRWQSVARHQLAASDSETLSLAELVAAAEEEDRRRWETLRLGYTDPRGSDWLRTTIAEGYETATAASIRCCTGGQEGIFTVTQALLGADDHAIVVTPNYQSAESIPAKICAVTGVSLDPADGWSLDVAALIAATRPNTKLISINFPNNPTGKTLERDRFDALIGFCRDRGIWLFSDEVYRLIERDQALRLPAAVDAYERGISLGGLSKPYGLPGLRVSWIACRDKGALRLFDRARSYLSICGAGPSEVLAQIALKAGDRLLARNRRIAAQNLTLLTRFFRRARRSFRLAPARWRGRRLPALSPHRGGRSILPAADRAAWRHVAPGEYLPIAIMADAADRFCIGFGRQDFAAGLDAMGAALDARGAKAQCIN